jgi:pimeloyl-ACP methyl ester carboxylesterase
MTAAPLPYAPRRAARRDFHAVRSLRYHVNQWGDATLAAPERPPLVLLHGWMDVGASFQFVVDALQQPRYVIAPDWRGFGLTESPGSDCYWFPDYLADLDALLDALLPGQTVDLLGHSMGGNIAMIYAGVRPARVRRLVNLEGFGLPESRPEQAPRRYAHWLDELRRRTLRATPPDDVAARCATTAAAPGARDSGAHWSAGRRPGKSRRPGAQARQSHAVPPR